MYKFHAPNGRIRRQINTIITDHLVALPARSFKPYMLVYYTVSGCWSSMVGLSAPCWPCLKHHSCLFFLSISHTCCSLLYTLTKQFLCVSPKPPYIQCGHPPILFLKRIIVVGEKAHRVDQHKINNDLDEIISCLITYWVLLINLDSNLRK